MRSRLRRLHVFSRLFFCLSYKTTQRRISNTRAGYLVNNRVVCAASLVPSANYINVYCIKSICVFQAFFNLAFICFLMRSAIFVNLKSCCSATFKSTARTSETSCCWNIVKSCNFFRLFHKIIPFKNVIVYHVFCVSYIFCIFCILCVVRIHILLCFLHRLRIFFIANLRHL